MTDRDVCGPAAQRRAAQLERPAKREAPGWARLLAAVELCAVIGPLAILGMLMVPAGFAGAVSSLQRGIEPAGLASVAWSICAIAGLLAAWRVLTRLAWYAKGNLRLTRLELVGVLCGLGAAAPFLPHVGTPELLFLDVLPVTAALLGIVHLVLHAREARRA